MILTVGAGEARSAETSTLVADTVGVAIKGAPRLVLAGGTSESSRAVAGAFNTDAAAVAVLGTGRHGGTVCTQVGWDAEALAPMADAMVVGAIPGTRNGHITRASRPTAATDTFSVVAHALWIIAVARALPLQFTCLPREAREAGTRAVNTRTVLITSVNAQHLATIQATPPTITVAGCVGAIHGYNTGTVVGTIVGTLERG